jgi:hypothetical protein
MGRQLGTEKGANGDKGYRDGGQWGQRWGENGDRDGGKWGLRWGKVGTEVVVV